MSMKNSGIMVTWAGTINVATTIMKRTSLPGKLIRAKAYPAIESMASTPKVAAAATITLLSSHLNNAARSSTSW